LLTTNDVDFLEKEAILLTSILTLQMPSIAEEKTLGPQSFSENPGSYLLLGRCLLGLLFNHEDRGSMFLYHTHEVTSQKIVLFITFLLLLASFPFYTGQ
jgi:hypothetical protein